MIELLELFAVFFKIGLFTFGGGLAMLPLLERELTSKRSWASSEELLDYYAIAQSTPGIIAVNVATFIGFKRKKIIGGIVATAGMVTPSLIIITIIAEFISNFEDIVWVQKALAGINVAVAALLTYSVFTFAKKTIKTWWSFLLYAASFSAVYFFHVHTVIVILSAALVGILIALVTGKLKKDERESA
ncbi:MAG TPA: chromate transporter [Treponema sp.]|nr:chromate transporter [Treponema sp.]